MNTNALARHYDMLTPRERVPLIIAAEARGDMAELGRLAQTAPRLGYGVPDFYGLSEGFLAARSLYMTQQLDLAVMCWQALAGICDGRSRRDGDRDFLWDPLNLICYLLVERAAGWAFFCRDFGVDPDGLLSRTPGWDVLQQTLQLARCHAFDREGAVKYVREQWGEGSAVPLTAEDVRAAYGATVQSQAATWR